MAGKDTKQSNGAVKKGVAYYKSDWMIKVLSNGYNAQAKLVFERIASFGEKGCWMNNETFGEEYGRTDRTIRRAVSSLWSKGDIIIVGWNNQSRKMYAASHPKVRAEINRQFYEAQKAGKIKDRDQFSDKIRLRKHDPIPVQAKVAEPEKVEVPPVRGLKHYLDDAKKRRKEGQIEPEK